MCAALCYRRYPLWESTASEHRGLLTLVCSCGNVGKVSRIASLLDDSFRTFAGFIDFLLPSVSVGSAGAISPLPNVLPVSDVSLCFKNACLPLDVELCHGRVAQHTKSQHFSRLGQGQTASGTGIFGRRGLAVWRGQYRHLFYYRESDMLVRYANLLFRWPA